MAGWPARLLDLGFLEGDVLARNGIVLLERKLVRRGPRIFLCDVEKAGAGRAQQLDLLGDRLSHGIEALIG